MDQHHLTSDRLDVAVDGKGAQLCSIRHRTYGEMLWQAEPIWPQHAPNLFPIVGQLAGDRLHYDGSSYPMTRHGFARARRFAWLERRPAACRLELRDDAETLAAYPFPFALEIAYAVDGDTLTIRYTIRNPGPKILPASIGAHPAFRWPIAAGVGKDAHVLEFAEPEPARIRRLQDGLLQLGEFPTPVEGSVLRLREDLFAADAIVMDHVASRSVRYRAPETPAIVVAWNGFRELGLWSKAGAEFLCIEPWYGYASPVDFDGPFEQKPGLLHIPPGRKTVLSMSITVSGAPVMTS